MALCISRSTTHRSTLVLQSLLFIRMWQPNNWYHNYGCITVMLVALWLISSLPSVQAKNLSDSDCSLPSDTDVEYHFILKAWVTRGGCIRENHQKSCSQILEDLLGSLAHLRRAEYASAASVLSLLPTIGALFGPPTSEIWRLKSIVPFGGALAMSLSFGGALMPVHVEDYENAVAKENTAIGSIISLRRHPPGSRKDAPSMNERLRMLSNKIRERVDRPESVRLPKKTLLLGLVTMFVLFSMAQAAMAVVEQGGVINFLCSARYWMHMWYFLGKCYALIKSGLQERKADSRSDTHRICGR